MPSTRPTVDPVLDILEELGYDFDELDGDGYKRSIREAIFRTHPDTGGKTADPEKFQILNEEFKRIRRGGKKPVEFKEKKTTIKPAKLLPGTATTKPDDLKQAQIDESSEDKSQSLQPDILNDIAKSVESIATLLKRQFGVEKKQQRDAKKQQDRLNKSAREDKLEGKPKDKKTGLIPKSIAKPAIGFFGKIKDFIFNIGIGTALYKMHDWLTDPENKDKIGKFTDFLTKHAPLILGGLTALAVLPVLGGIIGTVGGIMGGLSMLGLAVPLLPIILKGILIAAVAALAIAAVNWFAKKIVGGKGFSRARALNLKRFEKETKGQLNTKGEVFSDTGEPIFANVFGKNSLLGREWTEADSLDYGGKGKRHRVNIIDGSEFVSKEQHQAWDATNYGQESLDAKLASHSKYKTTLADIKSNQAEMNRSLEEQRGHILFGNEDEMRQEAYRRVGLPLSPIERGNFALHNREEYNAKVAQYSKILQKLRIKNDFERKSIERKYNREAMEIFNKSKEVNIDTSSDINNDQAFLKNNDKNRLISFVTPGTGGDQNQAITGSGSDSSGTPYFGIRNLDTFNTADVYNLRYTT